MLDTLCILWALCPADLVASCLALALAIFLACIGAAALTMEGEEADDEFSW